MHHNSQCVDATKVISQVLYCDPLNNDAIGTLKRLPEMAIHTICSGNDDHCIVTKGQHHQVHISTQPNGWNWLLRDADHSDARGGIHPRLPIFRFCKYGLPCGLHVTLISNGWVLIVTPFLECIEKWFAHEDVQLLRTNMAKWARRILGFPISQR